MALTNAYVQTQAAVPQLFAKLREGQAPPRVTFQYLKDLGFGSSNHRAFIPLLKALGFLTADGVPTQRYLDYRDTSKSKHIMAQALRDAYGDIFLIKEHPTAQDRQAIEGKFKSQHNTNDRLAGLMASTFLALLPLADLSAGPAVQAKDLPRVPEMETPPGGPGNGRSEARLPTLTYSINIQLPATKDVEVYNAIFKSLRDYLVSD